MFYNFSVRSLNHRERERERGNEEEEDSSMEAIEELQRERVRKLKMRVVRV